METNLDTNFVISENLFENNNQANLALSNFFKKDKSSVSVDKVLQKKPADIANIIESSSFELNNINLSNEITNGLNDFEFDAALYEYNDYNYNELRKRAHSQVVIACAQAAFFVGIANKIRRNIDEIRLGIVKQKTNKLINHLTKVPGLQIGVIGCGKTGKQLVSVLLEFAEVFPGELQISTRQPDNLTQFKAKNIRCCFDNARVASSVNILFLCVLPSQIELVVNEIKNCLPDRCIIYSLVRSVSDSHLKNLLNPAQSNIFIMKPEYAINSELDSPSKKWKYFVDVIECLESMDTIEMCNPFGLETEAILKVNENFPATLIYAILNICCFFGLTKKETYNALKMYLFSLPNKNIKLDETFFYDSNQLAQSQLQSFPIVDLVHISNNSSPLLTKLKQSKSLKATLANNFKRYFEDASTFRAGLNLLD